MKRIAFFTVCILTCFASYASDNGSQSAVTEPQEFDQEAASAQSGEFLQETYDEINGTGLMCSWLQVTVAYKRGNDRIVSYRTAMHRVTNRQTNRPAQPTVLMDLEFKKDGAIPDVVKIQALALSQNDAALTSQFVRGFMRAKQYEDTTLLAVSNIVTPENAEE